MEVEETMDVAPSAEQGNIPVDAPSEPTPEVVLETVEETPEVPPETPTEPELFDLPDGRKVDASTLAKEFKENFLPEFTRKSQELAEIKKAPLPETPKSPYEDPAYVPQTYEEIIKVAEERAIQAIEKKQADQVAFAQSIETAVATQLEEVKKTDPNVNENQLFLHANKYGFRDLKIAHQNMKDMAELTKTVQKQTVQNIQKRADPVSVSPGANGTVLNPDDFATPRDYLRALKGQ